MSYDRHILVTGGAGYIGSLLTSELLRANYRVTVLDDLLFGGESLLGFLHHPNFHFIKADVTQPRALRDNLRGEWPVPHAVVHLAAIVGFPACQAVGEQVVQRRGYENGFRAGSRPGRKKIHILVLVQQLWIVERWPACHRRIPVESPVVVC